MRASKCVILAVKSARVKHLCTRFNPNNARYVTCSRIVPAFLFGRTYEKNIYNSLETEFANDAHFETNVLVDRSCIHGDRISRCIALYIVEQLSMPLLFLLQFALVVLLELIVYSRISNCSQCLLLSHCEAEGFVDVCGEKHAMISNSSVASDRNRLFDDTQKRSSFQALTPLMPVFA